MGYRDRNFSFYPLMHSKYLYSKLILLYWASQVVLVIKNLPTNARDLRDAGSILGSGRCPVGGNGNPLSVFLHVKSHGQRL